MGTTRLPLLLILDANVIIAAHEFGMWDYLVRSHTVHIPSVVLNLEVYFYKKTDGTIVTIDLKSQVGKSVTEVSCTADELVALSEQLDSVTDQEIHAGEKEALVSRDVPICEDLFRDASQVGSRNVEKLQPFIATSKEERSENSGDFVQSEPSIEHGQLVEPSARRSAETGQTPEENL
jgi:hypothetical protein